MKVLKQFMEIPFVKKIIIEANNLTAKQREVALL